MIFGHFRTVFKHLDPLKMILGSEISIVILRPKFTKKVKNLEICSFLQILQKQICSNTALGRSLVIFSFGNVAHGLFHSATLHFKFFCSESDLGNMKERVLTKIFVT